MAKMRGKGGKMVKAARLQRRGLSPLSPLRGGLIFSPPHPTSPAHSHPPTRHDDFFGKTQNKKPRLLTGVLRF